MPLTNRASQAEAMGWLAYAYDASGDKFYYNTGNKLSTAWSNQFYSGGNGDGNLLIREPQTGSARACRWAALMTSRLSRSG